MDRMAHNMKETEVGPPTDKVIKRPMEHSESTDDTTSLRKAFAKSTSSPSGSATLSSGEATASSVMDHLPPPQQEYLDQLMSDKTELRALNMNSFKHVNKLIDNEISRVVSQMSNMCRIDEGQHDEQFCERVSLSEMIMVPVDKYPRYNFVGRILGPRGMTAKQLEEDTGCKIMVRGRGSSRMFQSGARRERANDTDPLHVIIQCDDIEGRAQAKMKAAIDAINLLLHPPPEGRDELKRKQLIELSIINGTYRPTTATKVALQTPRPSSANHLPSSLENSFSCMDASRLLSSLIESSKKAPLSPIMPKKNDPVEDYNNYNMNMLAFMGMHPPFNPALTAEYYKNLLSLSLTDPNMLSSLMSSPQNVSDPFNMSSIPSMSSSHSGASIPQANIHQYLTAASMLNNNPFLHDGSGDAPRSKR